MLRVKTFDPRGDDEDMINCILKAMTRVCERFTPAPEKLSSRKTQPDLEKSAGVLVNIPTLLDAWDQDVLAKTMANLQEKEKGTWADQADDVLFWPHTAYVKSAIRSGLSIRAARLWVERIAEEVNNVETRTRKSIHLGAPLFNVGLCYFVAGDYPRAMQYIGEAEKHDNLHGKPSNLLVGGGLAQNVLLKPLYPWVKATFGNAYKAATGDDLERSDLDGIIQFLQKRRIDAMLFLSVLHRIQSQMVGPENDASRLQCVRGLADLDLVFESSLRKSLGTGGNLFALASVLLGANASAIGTFNVRHNRYNKTNKELSTSVNTMVQDELAEFRKSSSLPERCAIAVYVTYRLRNSVQHVLDDNLDVFNSRSLLLETIGLGLAAIRASALGESGQLAALV